MKTSTIIGGLALWEFENFQPATILIESEALAGNPLGDPTLRRNPVLVPRGDAPPDGWPVVLVLSGLFGNGPASFNLKTFDSNTAQTIDLCVARSEAPRALYVFCDAMTLWGGSQFLNSTGTGQYETYILEELVGAVRQQLPAAASPGAWCVAGGSSGGYGALHLASRAPNVFGRAAAIAPDSFFEASLLPAIRSAVPVIESFGGVAGIRTELLAGRFMKRKDAHEVLNAIAMGLCYAPDANGNWRSPIHPETGLVDNAEWDSWRSHDPIVFLRNRAAAVLQLQGIYLDVGTRDQYHLQFGARQIAGVLRDIGARFEFTQFDGTHWDIGIRKPELWKWLTREWRRE